MVVVNDEVEPGDADAGWVALVLAADGDEEVAIGLVFGQNAGLAEVDVLARLQLAARRLGCTIRLRGATTELRQLLDLVGLLQLVDEPDG
jgi:hypothetical protein